MISNRLKEIIYGISIGGSQVNESGTSKIELLNGLKSDLIKKIQTVKVQIAGQKLIEEKSQSNKFNYVYIASALQGNSNTNSNSSSNTMR